MQQIITQLEKVIAAAVAERDALNAMRNRMGWESASDVADALDELSHARGILIEVDGRLAKYEPQNKTNPKGITP